MSRLKTNLNNQSFCFIGGLVLDSHKADVLKYSKTGIQNAPNAFQEAFIDGLRSNLPSLDVINLPFIGAYPLNYSKLFSPVNSSYNIQNSEGLDINIYNVRFCNLLFFKLYTSECTCYNALKDYCKRNKDKEYINFIVYSLHLPFLRATKKIKKKFSNVRVFCIVPDLLEYKNDNIPLWKKTLNNYDTHIKISDYNSIDGYILLSKFMAEKVVSNNQPYVIIEGLYKPIENASALIPKSTKKTVFYSGTLSRKCNIMNLVNAFSLIKDDNVQLMICGTNGCREEIEERAKKDRRIVYKGALPREQVLQLQREATLLVNPRIDSGEYTKYSFPSKTMEYLASGTPVLLHKLSGIPEEYYEYCYIIPDNTDETLAFAIENILNKNNDELETIGVKAKHFILSQKTPKTQCSKALQLFADARKNVF